MAVYIQIRKITESSDAAQFSFGKGGGPCGVLELNKLTGDVCMVQALAGDEEQFCYARAARKVAQHFARGELPEETCWAS